MTDTQPAATFEFVEPLWVYARGNEQVLSVIRTVLMDGTEELYRPVHEYIEQRGLVLVDHKQVVLGEAIMHAKADAFVYTTPQFRDELYTAGLEGEMQAGLVGAD